MTETVIAMLTRFRDEVLDGSRSRAVRPGWRGYECGPATIRFIDDNGGGYDDENAPPVDVLITSVEHGTATGKTADFMAFLEQQGLSSVNGKVTLLEWDLA